MPNYLLIWAPKIQSDGGARAFASGWRGKKPELSSSLSSDPSVLLGPPRRSEPERGAPPDADGEEGGGVNLPLSPPAARRALARCPPLPLAAEGGGGGGGGGDGFGRPVVRASVPSLRRKPILSFLS